MLVLERIWNEQWVGYKDAENTETINGKDQINQKCNYKQLYKNRAGAPVKWLKEETHNLKVMSLNPGTGYWMDIF